MQRPRNVGSQCDLVCYCCGRACALVRAHEQKEHICGLHKTTAKSLAEKGARSSWDAMFVRCYNAQSGSYVRYGGRGIKVCNRWEIFDNFLADMGIRPTGKTLDRIDTSGDYEPSNCRWATLSEQRRHRDGQQLMVSLTINGRTQLISDWVKESNGSLSRSLFRLKKGWSPKDAIFSPKQARPYTRVVRAS